MSFTSKLTIKDHKDQSRAIMNPLKSVDDFYIAWTSNRDIGRSFESSASFAYAGEDNQVWVATGREQIKARLEDTFDGTEIEIRVHSKDAKSKGSDKMVVTVEGCIIITPYQCMKQYRRFVQLFVVDMLRTQGSDAAISLSVFSFFKFGGSALKISSLLEAVADPNSKLRNAQPPSKIGAPAEVPSVQTPSYSQMAKTKKELPIIESDGKEVKTESLKTACAWPSKPSQRFSLENLIVPASAKSAEPSLNPQEDKLCDIPAETQVSKLLLSPRVSNDSGCPSPAESMLTLSSSDGPKNSVVSADGFTMVNKKKPQLLKFDTYQCDELYFPPAGYSKKQTGDAEKILFITSIHPSLTDEKILRDLFKTFGYIEEVKLTKNAKGGYAFIHYTSKKSVKDALVRAGKSHRLYVDKRYMIVDNLMQKS